MKTYRSKAKSMILARIIQTTLISQPTSDGLPGGNASKPYNSFLCLVIKRKRLRFAETSLVYTKH